MRGHVYRKTRPGGRYSRWYAVIDLPPNGTGKRRQRTTSHDTKRAAHAWLSRTAEELRAGEEYDSTVTVGEYLTAWLAGKQALRPSTRVEYHRHLAQVFIPALGHLRLVDLRAHHIEGVFHQLHQSNARRERPIGPHTMRHMHATLHSALNTAVRRGLIRRNPATTVELHKPAPTQGRAWSGEQVALFLAGTTEDPHHLLYRLLLFTGMRRGEVLGLRWGDVDLQAGTLTVHRQITTVNGVVHVGPPKSNAGIRTLALDQGTLDLLQLQRQQAEGFQPEIVDEDVDRRLMFTRSDGHGLHPGYVSLHFITLARGQGLPVIRLHDLRHTSASLGLAAGESLSEVSRRLGHSTIRVTADTYVHVAPATMHRSAQRLANHIDHVGTGKEAR